MPESNTAHGLDEGIGRRIARKRRARRLTQQGLADRAFVSVSLIQPPQTDRVHAAIVDLRHALACVDIPPDLEVPSRSLDDLATEVAALQRMHRPPGIFSSAPAR